MRKPRQTFEKALQNVNGTISVQVRLNPPEAIIEKAGNYSIGEDQPITPPKKQGRPLLWIA